MNKKNLKVYTVRVSGCIGSKNRWYAARVGESFTCVLVCKETQVGMMPQFAVVDVTDEGVIPPSIVRTIRPEDCTVLKERTHLVTTTARNYVERFAA